MKLKSNTHDLSLEAIRRRPVNVLASVMTTMNLYCGMLSIFASIGQEFQSAAYFILAAIIFDVLDGSVARMTKSTSEFGKELDSLCDLVSFGVAPGILVFCAYLPDTAWLPDAPDHGSIVGKTGSFMALIYVICTALRLARFNTYQSDHRDSFTGLPSPAAGAAVAAFVLFLFYLEPRLDDYKLGSFAYYALGPLAVIMSLLMVSTVRYPKDRVKAFILAPRHAFFALGTYAFIIAILHYAISKSPALVLFPLIFFYVFFGIADTAYNHFIVQRRNKNAAGKENETERRVSNG